MLGEAIKKMIHRYEGDLLVLNRLTNRCICSSQMTAEPDIKCPHCYGTGYRIKIKKIKGVVQESNGPSTMRKVTDTVVTKEIYIDESYMLQTKDLIIFDQEVYEAYQIKTFRTKSNKPVYRIVYATPLKYDSSFIVQSLKKAGAFK